MRKTKKILIITGWFPNEFEPSKCVFTKKMVEAQLQYTDCEITVICPAPYFPKTNLSFISTKFKNYSKLKYFYQNEGYKVFYPKYLKLPSPLSDKVDWFSFYKSVQRTIRKERLEFDIIHSHGLFPDSYAAALISNEHKKPLVVHVHDSLLNLIYKKYPTKVEYTLKTAVKILSVSNFQAQTLLNTVTFKDLKNKTSIVYNGVDTDTFKPISTKDLSPEKYKIIFIGSHYKEKGLDCLMRSIANLKSKHSIILDVFGEGKDKTTFIQLARSLEISSQVNFKGMANNDVIAQILPKYNLLVLPSQFETFGIVLIEAMACGIPVIATNITAIPEIVTNEEVGYLFSSGNTNELSTALEKAINKQWNKQYIREQAMKFSIENTAINIDQIYNSIISGRK